MAVVIAPWNFPLAILTGMTAAALVTGNTVIMKPAEQSSVIAAKLMEIFQNAGIPDGVVNYLPGVGEEVGPELVGNPDVDLIAFTGRCLVHRAEIMQLEGALSDALEEARRAAERCLQGENPSAAGEACYRQGEVHRVRGDFDAAEEAYREASRLGHEPQPGLSLLRLAQGESDAAGEGVGWIDQLTGEL